jgi:hypothetical protein
MILYLWVDAREHSRRIRYSPSLGEMFYSILIPRAPAMQIMSRKDHDKLSEFFTFSPDALTACFSYLLNDV